MEMFKTILSLGTGSLWKGVSILLAGLLIATSLFALKEVVTLHSIIANRDGTIKTQAKELTKKETMIKTLQGTVATKKAEIEVQNALILANKVDTDKRLKEVNEELVAITKRYQTLWDDINQWEGDKNATSCDNARNFLNSRKW
jgi:hypothetical protein